MIVGYGVTVPDGSLAVYSTDTEEQAEKLIVAACPTDKWTNEYYAPELAREQTLDNLMSFSDRLHQVAERINLFEEGRVK